MSKDHFYFKAIYKTLAPVAEIKNYHLSVGTINLLLPEEINLDFCRTAGNYEPIGNGIYEIEACISDHDNNVFRENYDDIRIYPKDLTYDFFERRFMAIRVKEFYTELYNADEQFVPLKLESLKLIFNDGRAMDISRKIMPGCQEYLRKAG